MDLRDSWQCSLHADTERNVLLRRTETVRRNSPEKHTIELRFEEMSGRLPDGKYRLKYSPKKEQDRQKRKMYGKPWLDSQVKLPISPPPDSLWEVHRFLSSPL